VAVHAVGRHDDHRGRRTRLDAFRVLVVVLFVG
jgi:hypothetical protein